MRAVDLHVHLPLPEWVEGSLGPYRAPTERYFRSQITLQTAEQLAAAYEAIDCVAVLLGWDAETATRLPRLSNDLVAEIVRRFPDRFVGFAGVDPWKGAGALREMRRAREDLGLIGYKFHPSMQAFRPDDGRWSDLFERAEDYRAPCLFHTGTSGIGAGTPGGQGVELAYARPIHLDAVAARHPGMPVIMAHFGWPWHLEAVAIALHKSNVYLELSGWAPRYVPDEVVREAEGRLAERVLFGSDAPFFGAEKVLAGWEQRLSPDAFRRVARDNAVRLLGLAG
ncbi:MAG TPA: amidohydrolase family protein [Actinomycetes bacterium]|nr:amidohydrolase family protein [Actinomycetes bacterium]